YEGLDGVAARGVCWSISPNPTTNDSHTVDGGGLGSFSSSITGLQPDTRYYIRAYATNGAGTVYGTQRFFNTLEPMPEVSTNTVSDISYTTATCGGNVTSEGMTPVTAKGVCWSTSTNPTINDSLTVDGSGLGDFTCYITGLLPNTHYYVRAYATNGNGTVYGTQRSFSTPVGTPIVSTNIISSITDSSAVCGGDVTNEAAYPVTARGVCWSTSTNPTINNNLTVDSSGFGNYTSYITGLQPNTRYYIRAYATNNSGTAYGIQRSLITTVKTPTVSTSAVSNITCIAADCGGTVSSDGISGVTAKGVCWSTSTNPTITDSLTIDGNDVGSFTSHITGLQPGTHYYVRAYATNNAGTVYGTQRQFTTPAATPTVTTVTVSNVTCTTAACGGNVTFEGIAPVTARGVCWSTSPNPTISDSLTVDSCGFGGFTSLVTGLQPNTHYYVRAYATNSAGTVYGAQRQFTTRVATPAVTTSGVIRISFTSVTCDGNVNYEGIAAVTARGVCWSTSPNPTVNDSHTVDSSGLGSFTSLITGLQPIVHYYVRAYATNSAGTAYGNEIEFTTTDGYPCPNAATLTDIDGNIYNTVQLGSQCWMRENLRTTRYANGTDIPLANYTENYAYRCYPNGSASNVSTYGYLYNWQAVMGGSASSNSNPSGVQGICPNGWHVPSDAEWTQLTDYVSSQSQYLCNGDSNYIGKALADNALSWSYDTTTCAVGNMPSNNNATNFSALPAGDITSLGYFGFLTFTNFWTATQYNNSRAYDRDIAWYVATVRRQDFEKVRGHSVRCLRNE
ncbi:MAG: fibrobacter succinogenes major paralogous domain-containing protein, partial [Bacteroidales bacterium]|nr:fibrobacter succinogenes major paralogous domain-containing protein [Bacteroidales bacterium]